MTISKTAVSVFASGVVAPGGTKATPSAAGSGVVSGTGAYKDTSTYGTSGLYMRIKNTAGAVGQPGMMTVQSTPDAGTTWFDLATIQAGTVSGDEITARLTIDRDVMGIRVLCYNHTTVGVTFEAILQAVAG